VTESERRKVPSADALKMVRLANAILTIPRPSIAQLRANSIKPQATPPSPALSSGAADILLITFVILLVLFQAVL